MNKQEQIEFKKAKPFEIGDYVSFCASYKKEVCGQIGRRKNKKTVTELIDVDFSDSGTIINVEDGKYKIEFVSSKTFPHQLRELVETGYNRHNQIVICTEEFLKHTFFECGSNPFSKEKRRIQFYNQEICSLFYKAGYGRSGEDYSEEELRYGEKVSGVNFNPYIIDKKGEKKYYQRDLVWTLNEKQLLVESIYNGIEIGKFLFRYNKWQRIEKEIKDGGIGYSFDCVDGKQRFFATLNFVQNKFPDIRGNYWNDLSGDAQRRFLNYGNLSYGELQEDATDEDVIDNFLTLNFTGVPMSQEHIDYVKSFELRR